MAITNINSLPVIRLSMGVGIDEDLVFCLAFFANDGQTPLQLFGITFTGTISGDSVIDAFTSDLVIGGLSGNLLALVVPAVEKVSWISGVYNLTITAADGTYTKDLLTESYITVGEAMPIQIDTIPPVDIVTSVPPQLFDLSFLGQPQPTRINTNQTLVSPNFYLVTAQNLTLTMPDPVASIGQIILKDMTGNPNATIVGTVDGDARGSYLRGAYQAIIFTGDKVGATWIAA